MRLRLISWLHAQSLEMFLVAIGDVAQANQMANVAKLSGVSTRTCYKSILRRGQSDNIYARLCFIRSWSGASSCAQGNRCSNGYSSSNSKVSLSKESAYSRQKKQCAVTTDAGQLSLVWGGEITQAAVIKPIENATEVARENPPAFSSLRIDAHRDLIEVEDENFDFNPAMATAWTNDFSFQPNAL